MSSASSSKALLKVLTAPSKIASALDWRKVSGGSILNLNIQKDEVSLALASHPSFGTSVHGIPSIPLDKRHRVTPEGQQQLADLVQQHKVVGFVVSWPLQKDTGKMGAACGRTLYTLEQLLRSQQEQEHQQQQGRRTSSVITPTRPLCLWDSIHPTVETPDEWGRSTAYGYNAEKDSQDDRQSLKHKTIHKASEEQYHQKEHLMSAQDVWRDFCGAFWPEIIQAEESSQMAASSMEPDDVQNNNDDEHNFLDLLEESDWAIDTGDNTDGRRVSAAV